MKLTCLMCIEKEHQTWLLVDHSVDQNRYLQQPFPYKQVDTFLVLRLT